MIMVIQHKGTPPKKRYAAKFLCPCGCVFWADDEDIKFPSYSVMREYTLGLKLAECPECGEQVASCLPEVPREKIFCGLRYDYGD